MPVLTRAVAGLSNCGAVFVANSGGPPAFYLWYFADLRRPWYDSLFVGDASMSGHNICKRWCPEHKVADIGRQAERWCLGVEEAVQARAHAPLPRPLTVPLHSAKYHHIFSFLNIDTLFSGANGTTMKTSCDLRAAPSKYVCDTPPW